MLRPRAPDDHAGTEFSQPSEKLMIESKTSRQTVLQFNDCINSGDIAGLAALMTDDHRFIDSANSSLQGKESALKAWRGFFASYPDYRNVFEDLRVRDGVVIIVGHSVCSDKRLDGPALWTAKVLDGKVAEWRVYDDTPGDPSTTGRVGNLVVGQFDPLPETSGATVCEEVRYNTGLLRAWR